MISYLLTQAKQDDLSTLRIRHEELRKRQQIQEALRARQFTSEETLEMGLSLIDFALRFNKEARRA